MDSAEKNVEPPEYGLHRIEYSKRVSLRRLRK
jgi:hypothetical protein